MSESPMPAQSSPESASVLGLAIAPLSFSAPWRWLQLGLQDFRRCPRIGLFYGACFVIMGHLLWEVFYRAPAWALALSAGFLLMGPFLCLGLYEASRRLHDLNESPRLEQTIMAWSPAAGTLAIFAGVLLILEMLWARASLVVFAVAFEEVPDPKTLIPGFLQGQYLDFLLTYMAVGAVFAGIIFMTCVIAIPLILDRRADAISAGLLSIRACFENPAVMLFWGALVTGLTVAAMLPRFLGLLVIAPVLGHASWHAYREMVGAPASFGAGSQSDH